MHPLIARAFETLNSDGCRWLLLRGADDLAHPAGDVDVLVSPHVLPRIDRLLQEAGFQRMVARGHGSHRFYFAFDAAEHLWLKLDLVSDIRFGPYQQWRSSLAHQCLERRVKSASLWLPAPADQAWLQLLHLVLDKGEVTPERMPVARQAAAVAASEDPLAQFLDQRVGPGTANALLEIVKMNAFQDVPALALRMRTEWTRAGSTTTRITEYANRAQRLLSPTLRGRFAHGLRVAVMGPDGAGKTTLLQGIGRDLPLPSKYVYMGLWSGGRWDATLHRLPGGRLSQKVFRLARGSVTAAYHYARGRLVLLDRVAYDAKLPGSVDTSAGGRITSALLLAFGPKPDVLLMLDAPGEVMFARKGEHTVEILESWRQAYLKLAEALPNAWVLDATEPQDVVLNRGVSIVWSQLCSAERRSKPDEEPGR
jgi:thymidylate kinase